LKKTRIDDVRPLNVDVYSGVEDEVLPQFSGAPKQPGVWGIELRISTGA
jgi:hypothetical protein